MELVEGRVGIRTEGWWMMRTKEDGVSDGRGKRRYGTGGAGCKGHHDPCGRIGEEIIVEVQDIIAADPPFVLR